MPRQLKEIKNFNLGTILNLSEKDIPEDAAAYSLNIDPLSENGILNSIKCDRKFFTSNEKSSFLEAPISWGIYGIYQIPQTRYMSALTILQKDGENDLQGLGRWI